MIGHGSGPPTLAGMNDDPYGWPLRPSAVNLTGMPALSIPCGFTDNGIPPMPSPSASAAA
jgi:Asp-tRNA(Asn)/Glu-tRNA(Gln) amidotransferase A subunit family amidase